MNNWHAQYQINEEWYSETLGHVGSGPATASTPMLKPGSA